MTNKELIILLQTFPDNAVIGYTDINFGGMYEEMDTFSTPELNKENQILFRAPTQSYIED